MTPSFLRWIAGCDPLEYGSAPPANLPARTPRANPVRRNVARARTVSAAVSDGYPGLIELYQRSDGGSTPLAESWSDKTCFKRESPASLVDSQRATSTSWVFEARSSHQPSPVFTRTPSMSKTSAPFADTRLATSSMTANLR